MKNMKKILVMLAVILSVGIYTADAQIIVRVRPERPKYVRVVSPGPRHVWIEEDWEPRGQSYVFVGGRWAEPPRDRGRWVPGHWRHRPHGWVWVRGHWRR